ncbi:MAG: hypothetical protein ACR2FE_12045 [Aeromicrobium sp.]
MDARVAVIGGAYGIVVDSEFAIPLPDHPHRAPDLRVTRGTVDAQGVGFAPVQGVDDEADIWIEMGWDGERTVLRFTDLMAEMVGDHITIDPIGGDDLDYLAHLILDHIVPRWLALHGDVVLHAGAVVSPRGQAVALIGDPGRGKSSMTTALGQAGWTVLGDDACRLVHLGDGWLAHPSYPGTRLLSDSRQVLVPGAASTPMSNGADKHRLLPDVPFATSPARLATVVELGDDSASPSIRPLSYSQATASLTRHSFFLAPRRSDVAPRAFTLSSSVAADVPCVRLEFPRRWDVYPEVIEMLEQLEGLAA